MGGCRLEMGVGNLSSTFVLGTLEPGKHDVNNVNTVQCLITVSIGEVLIPGEETQAAASISVHSYTDAKDARHSTAQRSTRYPPNKFSVRGQLQFSDRADQRLKQWLKQRSKKRSVIFHCSLHPV